MWQIFFFYCSLLGLLVSVTLRKTNLVRSITWSISRTFLPPTNKPNQLSEACCEWARDGGDLRGGYTPNMWAAKHQPPSPPPPNPSNHSSIHPSPHTPTSKFTHTPNAPPLCAPLREKERDSGCLSISNKVVFQVFLKCQFAAWQFINSEIFT